MAKPKVEIKFPIGKSVRFIESVRHFTEDGKIIIQRSEDELSSTGIIVGGTYKVIGDYVPSGGDHEEYESGYVGNPVKVFVYLIRRGYINKPAFAVEEDIELLTDDEKHFTSFPIFHSFQTPWDEEDRQFMRDEMREWPRNEKGHWLKKGETK